MNVIRRRHGMRRARTVSMSCNVLWCSLRVICHRNHVFIVEAAVDQPLEEEEVEIQGRGHPGMTR